MVELVKYDDLEKLLVNSIKSRYEALVTSQILSRDNIYLLLTYEFGKSISDIEEILSISDIEEILKEFKLKGD